MRSGSQHVLVSSTCVLYVATDAIFGVGHIWRRSVRRTWANRATDRLMLDTRLLIDRAGRSTTVRTLWPSAPINRTAAMVRH